MEKNEEFLLKSKGEKKDLDGHGAKIGCVHTKTKIEKEK